MAYDKNTWVDQNVERPRTYEMTNNADGSVTLIDSFGLVDELGTPVNADYMNHIEEGIAGCAIRYHNMSEIFEKDEWVTGIVEGEKGIYKSLIDGNQGNSLTDTANWEELKLGGGGGLEICDIGMALYVDETKGLRRYLNGQLVAINANTQAFLDRLKLIQAVSPSLFTTEENWQAEKTVSAFGQVGKFVIADDESSVRLPAVVNVQGLLNLQNLGMTVQAGLPDITVDIITSISNNTSTFPGQKILQNTKSKNLMQGNAQSTASNQYYLQYKASRVNSIFGNSDTVQEEAIQYPYFIQIATGQETEANIVNEIELNNPYTLFDSKYSEAPLYNASWLLSNGTYYSGSIYVTVYEGLQVEYNTEITVGTTVQLPSGTSYTKRGLNVKLSTETYDDYDYVLKTVDNTFRLPLLNGSEDLEGDNFVSLGTPIAGQEYTIPYNATVSFKAKLSNANGFVCLYNKTSEIETTSPVYMANGDASVFIDSKKDNVCQAWWLDGYLTTVIAFGYTPKVGNGALYYYIGDTVQNANLINAGRIEEQLINKLNLDCANVSNDGKVFMADMPMPSHKYIDLTLGAHATRYTVPANGWVLFGRYSSGSGNYIALESDAPITSQVFSHSSGQMMCIYIPVAKGDTFVVYYNATGTVKYFRFIYAVGSESEAQ